MISKPKNIGIAFEERFYLAVTDAGYYAQKMPDRVGFDFLIGRDSSADQIKAGLFAVELKCIAGNRLRLKHFTPFEQRTAEDMHAHGINYYIVFPLWDKFGEITWAEIREDLLVGKNVTLKNPFRRWPV